MNLSVHGSAMVFDPADIRNVDVSALQAKIPGISLRRIPVLLRLALLASVEALDSAGWNMPETLEHTALVVGSSYGCPQTSLDFMDSILDNGPNLSSPTAFSHAVNNVHTGLLSLHLGLRGPCMNVTQFARTFEGAVLAASALIHSHRVERVLLGMVDDMSDSRFAPCYPSIVVEGLAGGAVFFCVGTETPTLPALPQISPQGNALAQALATFRALA